MGNPAFIAGVIVIGIITIVGAVFIGKSDSGEINVSAAIQSSNQANNAEGGDTSKNVETVPEAFRNMTNGGLVPQENQPEPQVVEPVPTQDISSSTATSTPVEGEGEELSEEPVTETAPESTENAAQ